MNHLSTPPQCNAFPTLAIAVKAQDSPDHLSWALANDFALEYSPDQTAFGLLPVHLGPAIQAGVPVRFHGRYFGQEIGHPDTRISESAMKIHLETLYAMDRKCEPVVTFHLDLSWNDPFDPEKAVNNLSVLVNAAKRYGITVCIENLRAGAASHPENILAWAEASGASITLDVGHAISCQRVQKGELSVTDFIDLFDDRLAEVHIYGYEADRHYPVTDARQFEPIITRLLQTSCRWWTIELEDRDEALSTRRLLKDCMSKAVSSFSCPAAGFVLPDCCLSGQPAAEARV